MDVTGTFFQDDLVSLARTLRRESIGGNRSTLSQINLDVSLGRCGVSMDWGQSPEVLTQLLPTQPPTQRQAATQYSVTQFSVILYSVIL